MATPRELVPSIISNSGQNVCFWHLAGIRRLSSGAVERDPRHNSQPNLLYPFAPLLVLQGGSADLFSLTFLQGPQVPCSAPSVILGRILRRE